MRKTYQVLANTIAVLVVVQAGAIAWAFFGLSNEIDQNGLVINKACLESDAGCGGTCMTGSPRPWWGLAC